MKHDGTPPVIVAILLMATPTVALIQSDNLRINVQEFLFQWALTVIGIYLTWLTARWLIAGVNGAADDEV